MTLLRMVRVAVPIALLGLGACSSQERSRPALATTKGKEWRQLNADKWTDPRGGGNDVIPRAKPFEIPGLADASQ